MFKVDLHTHSTASHDGGITEEQYMQILEDGILDCIAITDHNTIELAKRMHVMLGNKIIVGEEIMTSEGEIIGLFLDERIKPGMSAKDTMYAIRKQKGIVYIPHPLETVRKGVSREVLDAHADLVNIIEVYNGRAVVQNRGPAATVWARLHQKATAASSDAHGVRGMGTAFTVVAKNPNRHNLIGLMQLGHLTMRRPPWHSLFYPKINKLRQALRGRA
jgi:predicted metal-dependent phosphoesterase TrpH